MTTADRPIALIPAHNEAATVGEIVGALGSVFGRWEEQAAI